ncbi:MAG TPA: outer membrane beta-barrel protein [Steroidobacteraceae bacterium]|jgi:opacity protein-like surface antigen|nr:outer membrane beta-barrel protein [Steroidobacteraceae bacterium]
MKSRYIITLAALCSAWSLAANAGRDVGWEFGGEVIYQNSQDVDFEGGSKLSMDSDVGLALTFGYRFSSRLELTMGLDWNNVDYDGVLQSGDFPNLTATVKGSMESFVPRVGLNFNFVDGPITPYVTGSIGYAFIDTNIPNGPAQGGCWWDPWYGQICGTWQPTKSVDEFTYSAGLGVRWDINNASTMRFAYEKHWIDVSSATSTPNFDQFKIGFSFQY